MGTFSFINIMILLFGIYLIYACVQLKVSGVPTKGVMIGGRVNYKNAKDLPGFTAYAYKRCLICGIAISVLAIGTLLCDLFRIGVVSLLLMLGELAVCIYYTKVINYAQQTFILGLDVELLKERQKQMKEEKKAAKKNRKKG